MLNPLEVEARLAHHAEAVARAERHGWMRPHEGRGRRLGRARDRVAHMLFALAARVDPEAVPTRLRSGAPSGRL